MQEQPTKASIARAAWWWSLPAMPLFYLMVAVPLMARTISPGGALDPMLQLFFAPAGWVYDHLEPYHQFIDWCIG
ncbi:MAG: hypothetical protein ACI9UA_002345 [Pseudoalteromonas tetraodonis]|jgi:hypothetical protein